MGKLGVKALIAGAASCAVWSLLAGGVAGAADLKLKAPPLLALPPAPAADAIPMFGDFQDLDSDTNVRRGSFKIQENESPRPMDRVYINSNFYSAVDLGTKKVDIQRETLGIEKTFLDGNASIGVRLPFFQNLDSKDGTGDITIIGKYAFINDRATGNVLSGGLAVTVPTGDFSLGRDFTQNQDIHSTIVQPFLGAHWTLSGGFFVQGFSSLAIPTDDRDVTLWFNSIGIGYNMYQGGASNQPITAVVPTVELHFNSPLNHQDDGAPQKLENIVNLTAGVHVEVFNKAIIGLAISTPLTSPKPYDVEGIASFNLRF